MATDQILPPMPDGMVPPSNDDGQAASPVFPEAVTADGAAVESGQSDRATPVAAPEEPVIKSLTDPAGEIPVVGAPPVPTGRPLEDAEEAVAALEDELASEDGPAAPAAQTAKAPVGGMVSGWPVDEAFTQVSSSEVVDADKTSVMRPVDTAHDVPADPFVTAASERPVPPSAGADTAAARATETLRPRPPAGMGAQPPADGGDAVMPGATAVFPTVRSSSDAQLPPEPPASDGSAAAAGDPDGKKPRKAKKGHPFLAGLLGGAVACGCAALLWGVLAGPLSGVTKGINRSTTESAAGPTINIADPGDATTAEAVAAKCLPSVVSINVSTSQGDGVGSGVVYDTQGNILTNYHVVEGASDIAVSLGGQSYEGTVVGSDESSDLAVVHIDLDGATVTPMERGDSSALVVGEWVMALGSPFGLDQSVSTGIVSSLYRSTMLEGTSGNTIYTNLIQTDTAINPGNSGGALVNDQGQLVGINSIIESASGSSSGVGFAIPSNYAVEVADAIIAGRTVEHAYLGANVATVTPQAAARRRLAVNQGAYVASVTQGGPAAEAGLAEGDIVTRLGDEEITSADGLILAVRSHAVGDTVKLTYYRGSEEHTVDVTLGSDASGDTTPERQQSTYEEDGEDGSFSSGNPWGGAPLDDLADLLGMR